MLIAPGGAGRKARHAVGNQMSIARGTESSNPLPSSGESGANLSLRRSSLEITFPLCTRRDREFESCFLQRRVRSEPCAAGTDALGVIAASLAVPDNSRDPEPAIQRTAETVMTPSPT